MVPLLSLSKTRKAARSSASESDCATLWAIMVANSVGEVGLVGGDFGGRREEGRDEKGGLIVLLGSEVYH